MNTTKRSVCDWDINVGCASLKSLYVAELPQTRVAPEVDMEKIRSLLAPLDFTRPLDPLDAVDFVARNLWDYQVHTPHPRYFGLFNPAPTTMGIVADALVATFNPQALLTTV